MKSLAVFGVGLIGGSAALAIRQAFPAIQITGYGRRIEPLRYALEHGIIDQIGDPGVCPEAQLCLVAAPPMASLAILERLEQLAYMGLVTDAVSVKQPVETLAKRPFWQGRLVPAHPIAGTENRGPESAMVDLFRGSATIVTPVAQTPPAALQAVQAFWIALGCRLETMSAEAHDQRYAEVSHTPHAIIFALASLLLTDYSPDELAQRSGGGLRGLLRIAASSPDMWRQVLELNRGQVLQLGDRYIVELQQWLNLLREERGDALEAAIEKTSTSTRRYLDQWQALRNPSE